MLNFYVQEISLEWGNVGKSGGGGRIVIRGFIDNDIRMGT